MDFFIDIILPVLLLAFGFALLVKGAGWFVDGSSGIAKKLGVSQMVIALTIVAMGTSIPETAVSLQAALQDSADLAVGNIVGTNTLNILLILGLTAVITPLFVQRTTLRFEIPMVICTAVVFGFLGLGKGLLFTSTAVDGSFSRIEGIILLALFGAYIVYLWWLSRKTKVKNALMVIEKQVSWKKLIFILLAGFALIIAGSSLTVNSAVKIAENLGISERFIGLTIVALGTSLPELATSITAAVKKQDDLAVGNIVGSNIYNMLFIGGLMAVIKPVEYAATFAADSLICTGASMLLLLVVLANRRKMLSRSAGAVMLLCYAAYFAWLLQK